MQHITHWYDQLNLEVDKHFCVVIIGTHSNNGVRKMAILIRTKNTTFEDKRAVEAPLGAIGFDSCTRRVEQGFLVDDEICAAVKYAGKFADMVNILTSNNEDVSFI